MARRPFWARSPEDAEQLCWDEFCLINLANFLPPDSDGIFAVTAKGCDWRNLVVHHQENRLVLPSQVVVLGIDCEGMLDPEKIYQAAGGPERVLEVNCTAEQVTITVTGGEVVIDRADVYRQACLDCIQQAPLSADHLFKNSEPRQRPGSENPPVEESPQDSITREATFKAMFKNCLMCFACRDICPLCYCSQCFVDVEKSHWLSAQAPIDRILDFHFMRAHHIAGRCTECGACETACPMNIPVRQLATRLNRDIAESSGYIPGLALGAEAPDGVFRPSYHEHSERRT
jgi:ferredoxin